MCRRKCVCGNWKYYCKKCKGTGLCPPDCKLNANKWKRYCRVHGGSMLCELCKHNIVRRRGVCGSCKKARAGLMRHEERVHKVLQFAFPDEEIIKNKGYGKGDCSSRQYRPDFLFAKIFMPSYSAPFRIIVECDENKHAGQAYKCDVKRMSEIAADLGFAVKVIRFNPDSERTLYADLIEAVRTAMQSPMPRAATNFTAVYLFY